MIRLLLAVPLLLLLSVSQSLRSQSQPTATPIPATLPTTPAGNAPVTQPTPSAPSPVVPLPPPPEADELHRTLVDRLEANARSLEQTRQQLASANARATALSDQTSKLQTEIELLKARLAAIDRNNIAVITYLDRSRTDTSVGFLFKTEKLGRLHARLRVSGGATREHRSEPDLRHAFVFTGLAPDTEYTLEINALDAGGADTAVRLSPDQLPDLRVKTLPTVTTPAAYLLPTLAGDISPASIRLRFNTNERAIIVVSCTEVLEPTLATAPCKHATVGSVTFDAIGRPVGEFRLPGAGAVDFDGLEPDRPYVFHITAYNEFGRQSAEAAPPTPVRTLKAPVPLDFRGPFSLEIRPDRVIAQWTPTAQPQAAEFRLALASGETVTAPATFDSTANRVSAVLPVGALTAALTALRPTTATSLPTLTAVMTASDGRQVTRAFQLTAKVPRLGTAAALSSPTLTEAVTNLGDAIDRPNRQRLTWQNLVNIGLPIILSFL